MDSRWLKDGHKIPKINVNPVLIARYMLCLVAVLQHTHPDINEEIGGLSEAPLIMMHRLANSSTSLVTANEDLLSIIVGLTSVMMEAHYLANGGNLRRCLIVIRRAIVVAQLMGLSRPQAQAQFEALDSRMN